MDTQVRRSAPRRGALRLLLALAIVAGLLVFGSLGTGHVQAQPVLELDVSCQPDPVRPNEGALMTCTIRTTNSGDEAATNLVSEVAASSNCALPSQLIPPLIYLFRDGELQPVTFLSLFNEQGDLGPGQTVEIVVQLAVLEYSSGPVGGMVTVRSEDDPSVTVSSDICWTVDAGADAPPTNLQVTKTLLTEFDGGGIENPPPPPPGGGTVPIDVPNAPEVAEYEIAVSNASGGQMNDVTAIDVELGGAVLIEADPAPTGTDPLGRPMWELGDLAPGTEMTIHTTVGPSPGSECAYSDDIAFVTATPAGGAEEGYVAFADGAIPVGPCGPFPGDYCWHYPPDGEPVPAPCDVTICWSIPPEGGEPYPIYDCDPDAEYCWFYAPGDSEGFFPWLSPCSDEVCWLPFGGGDFEFYFPAPCDEQGCEYTAPDGSDSFTSYCDDPVCWTSPPGGEYWQPTGCDQFDPECWWSAEGEGLPVLDYCDPPICFPVPPEGATTFGEMIPLYCDQVQDLCWPVPAEAMEYFSLPIPCDEVEYYCWLLPPGDGIAFPAECDVEFCWEPLPPDVELPPGIELPPDLLIPVECAEGEEGKLGVPGTSLPAEVVPGVSSPAEIVEGTVERIDPLPSGRVVPAELIFTDHTEPGGPPPDESDNNRPPHVLEHRSVADALGITRTPSGGPNVTALPQSGVALQDDGTLVSDWLVVAALMSSGLAAIGLGVRMRRRHRSL